MNSQITINTYLQLDAGAATLIEDVPVQLTVCGEDDGCGELHWWIEELRAEFIGKDLVISGSEAVARNGYGSGCLEHLVMKALYERAEKDEAVHGEIADQLQPLVFGRAA